MTDETILHTVSDDESSGEDEYVDDSAFDPSISKKKESNSCISRRSNSEHLGRRL
jgi:hypothetical protein